MDIAFQIKTKLIHAQRELLDIKSDLTFAKFIWAAIKAGFNEYQPRDENGRWTVSGGSTFSYLAASEEGHIAYRLAAAGRQSAAYCWNQMQIDMLVCSTVQPAWKRAVCRGQANQRYGACLAGTQIPPLSY